MNPQISPWFAECQTCPWSAPAATDWAAEDKADVHAASNPSHSLDVYAKGTQ
ncbi:hypothetical protein QEH44_gp43 [Arthrobacter phage Shambre1]|uniref:Uncharacterized protein n=1 Tax=Arthrobacter phage Shambre1 TaxID=2927284 RepID=A0A977KNK8_9CAUD|nr:hypothetical protein QEH44_gp43 [Arthrobacter phage Shambre1]UXE04779.1 hypothetical protein SEA_SHAMBRE1_43 [Arthrobacter phage Shambre1]